MPLTTKAHASNEPKVYAYLMANGFSLSQTCGILANIEAESGFDVRAKNDDEEAYGICQWRENRKSELFSRSMTTTPSLYDQTRFIKHELSGSEKNAKEYLDSVENNRDGAYYAGLYFADRYERCASEQDLPRANRAQQYWDYYLKHGSEVNPTDDITFPEETPSPGVSTSSSSIDVVTSPVVASGSLSMFTATDSEYGHLIDITTGDDFKFYIPEFQESAGVNWDPINIPGRSVQIHSYQYTNSRKISVSLDLYAGVGLYTADAYEDVVAAVHNDANFIKSLEYPEYADMLVKPPHKVLLTLGSSIRLEGIVEDVTVEHMKPLDAQNRSMYLKVSFTVTQDVLSPPSYQEIRQGITSTVTSTDHERFYSGNSVNLTLQTVALGQMINGSIR